MGAEEAGEDAWLIGFAVLRVCYDMEGVFDWGE